MIVWRDVIRRNLDWARHNQYMIISEFNGKYCNETIDPTKDLWRVVIPDIFYRKNIKH